MSIVTPPESFDSPENPLGFDFDENPPLLLSKEEWKDIKERAQPTLDALIEHEKKMIPEFIKIRKMLGWL